MERHGIDIDEVESDFFSQQAIRSYLDDYRDAETIWRPPLRPRTVTERSPTELRTASRTTFGEHRLFVDIDVLCEECRLRDSVTDLTERGGDCDDFG